MQNTKSVDSIRQRLARTGSWRRKHRAKVKKDKVTAPAPIPASIRISTFPRQFEELRDRLFERAKSTPAFLETVFTLHATPSDDEVMQAVENRFFTIIQDYPFWFGHTPDADAKSNNLRRDHDITHGFIKAAPLTANQQAALAQRKQERVEREQRISARAGEAVVSTAS